MKRIAINTNKVYKYSPLNVIKACTLKWYEDNSNKCPYSFTVKTNEDNSYTFFITITKSQALAWGIDEYHIDSDEWQDINPLTYMDLNDYIDFFEIFFN